MRDKLKKSEYDKKRYKQNKIILLCNIKSYYENNKEKINKQRKPYSKKYYLLNKEKIKKMNKKWVDNNSENRKQYLKTYRENNKVKRNKNIKDRKLNDDVFKLILNIRSLISSSFKRMNYSKSSKTKEILGCDFDFFKKYIENQFEPWMNWGNYGNPIDGIFELNKTWDIDHIIPISASLSEGDVIKLNHYTNLKPLCSYYNRWIKSNQF